MDKGLLDYIGKQFLQNNNSWQTSKSKHYTLETSPNSKR